MVRTLFAAVLVLAAAFAGTPARPELSQVKNVYLLTMGYGMDQYLANFLTRNQIYQVVADPNMADAILTDQIGKDFEEKLNELYPKAKDEDEEEEKDSKSGTIGSDKPLRMRSNSFGRGRGNVFLVDSKTRRILWSYHLPSKNGSVKAVSETASRIVKQLERDINGK